MIYESMNTRALNVALRTLCPDSYDLVKKLYELLNVAEQVAHDEGYEKGYNMGFSAGWKEGYDIGDENARENIYGASTLVDVDVAAAALNLDETLSLPPYEGDSGDEG
jgi:hypothetical protein